MDAFVQWLKQLQFDGVWQTLVLVAASVLCMSVHETCHGLCAYWLGDPTAKRMGRLSLNPLKHVDLSGLFMMALFRFGWAKPVPVNMRYFKNPKAGMALTALAGPVSNVLLAYAAVLCANVCMFFLQEKPSTVLSVVTVFFVYLQILSAGLAVFNLLPIPPLDGSKVLFALFPQTVYEKIMRYEKYGMLLLAVVLFSGVLDVPLYWLRTGLMQVLELAGNWPIQLLAAIY